MKQLIFMIITTMLGTIGVVYRPFWGVAVYYLYATLRPQFLWEWALPSEVEWSRFVGLATVAGTFAASLGMIPLLPPGIQRIRRKFGRSQISISSFCLLDLRHCFMARNQDVAFEYFAEYVKIFAMMAASMVLLYTVNQLYFLVILPTLCARIHCFRGE